MRPEIKKLIDIATKEAWIQCGDGISEIFLARSRSSEHSNYPTYPRIYKNRIAPGPYSSIHLMEDEKELVWDIFSEQEQREKDRKDAEAWKLLMDYLK